MGQAALSRSSFFRPHLLLLLLAALGCPTLLGTATDRTRRAPQLDTQNSLHLAEHLVVGDSRTALVLVHDLGLLGHSLRKTHGVQSGQSMRSAALRGLGAQKKRATHRRELLLRQTLGLARLHDAQLQVQAHLLGCNRVAHGWLALRTAPRAG